MSNQVIGSIVAARFTQIPIVWQHLNSLALKVQKLTAIISPMRQSGGWFTKKLKIRITLSHYKKSLGMDSDLNTKN